MLGTQTRISQSSYLALHNFPARFRLRCRPPLSPRPRSLSAGHLPCRNTISKKREISDDPKTSASFTWHFFHTNDCGAGVYAIFNKFLGCHGHRQHHLPGADSMHRVPVNGLDLIRSRHACIQMGSLLLHTNILHAWALVAICLYET